MVFKETFESTIEAEKEIQNFLTYLEEHKHYSEKNMKEGKLLKSYAEEMKIEKRLVFLNSFLKTGMEETDNELKIFKKGLAAESLKLKCKQIDNWVQSEFLVEEDEDYGEED